MSEPFLEVVRVAGVDLDGTNVLVKEVAKIKGVGPSMAVALVRSTGIPERLRVGLLSEAQIAKLETMLKNLSDHVPRYFLNRRKDMQSGLDVHLVGSDLALQISRDIDFEKKMGSWRGIRHRLGLKVRGQRTKTSGRRGVTVGVSRRKRK